MGPAKSQRTVLLQLLVGQGQRQCQASLRWPATPLVESTDWSQHTSRSVGRGSLEMFSGGYSPRMHSVLFDGDTILVESFVIVLRRPQNPGTRSVHPGALGDGAWLFLALELTVGVGLAFH